MWTRGVSALLLIATGCGSSHRVLAPLSVPAGTQSLLLGLEGGGDLRVFGFDDPDLAQPILQTIRDGDRISALSFDRPLALLGIEVDAMGSVAPAEPGDPGRALPPAQAVFVWNGSAWEGAVLSPALERFHLPSLTPARCLDFGGCFISASDICTLPCRPIPSAPTPPTPPAPPMPPQPPRLACPEGWSIVDAGTLTTAQSNSPLLACEPPPVPPAVSCPDGQAQFYGASGCENVGPPCPAGDWADNLPPNAIYVRAGAPSGGNGTLGAPFARISDAIAGASGGSTIALSKGSFDEDLSLGPGASISIVGACARDTVLDPSVAPNGTIWNFARHAQLRALQIRSPAVGVSIGSIGRPLSELDLDGVILKQTARSAVVTNTNGILRAKNLLIVDSGYPSGMYLTAGSTATVERTVILGSDTNAVLFKGARVSMKDLVIRDTRPLTVDIGTALAVSSDGGTANTVDRATISGTPGVAVSMYGATRLALSNTTIQDSVPSSGNQGGGIRLFSGSQLLGHALLIERFADFGLVVDASTATISGLVLRDGGGLGGSAPSVLGRPAGMLVQHAGSASISRSRISEIGRIGVWALSHARLSLADLVIEDIGTTVENFGLQIEEDSTATVTRASIKRTPVAILVNGAQMSGSDLWCAETTTGTGAIRITTGGRLKAQRLSIRGGRTAITVLGSTTSAQLRDLMLGPTTNSSPLLPGVHVTGGVLELDRALLSDINGAAFALDGGGLITARDLMIRNTVGEFNIAKGRLGGAAVVADAGNSIFERLEIDGTDGPAMAIGLNPIPLRSTVSDLVIRNARGGALITSAPTDLHLERALIDQSAKVGLSFLGTTTASVTDVEIAHTVEAENGSGDGIDLLDVSSLWLTRFTLRDNAGAGILIRNAEHGSSGTAKLNSGQIHGNATGVRLEHAGSNVRDTLKQVVVHDNGTNLDDRSN